MNKKKPGWERCEYCSFTYKERKDYFNHLNEQHVRCGVCFKNVFDVDDFEDGRAVCEDCREKGS